VGAGGIAVRVLHLDHVGAEVPEHRGGQRAGVDGGRVDHPHSGEWSGTRLLGGEFEVVGNGHHNSFVSNANREISRPE
jgi:hypothetical protein